MSAFANALVLAAEKTTAEEGRDIILSMLVVGLIFISVIAIGQTVHWLRHRRQ
jgi:heme/copper-type cytochrome/quinol oxidase subunit 2